MPGPKRIWGGIAIAACLFLAACGGGGSSSSGSGSSGGSSTSGSSSGSGGSSGSGSGAPVVSQSPDSASIVAGQSATLTVVASGAAPLSYQWRRGGAAIAGATSASYTTPALGTLDSGASFDVVVANADGSATSAAALLTVTAPVGGSDVLTWHNDLFRSGQNLGETTLTPANVNVATFGLKGFLSVDGKIDAQPLYAAQVAGTTAGTKNLLIVATEHGSVYAFDAGDDAATVPATVVWKASLIPTGETPATSIVATTLPAQEVAITATPFVDRTRGANGTIFLLVESMVTSGASTTYIQRLHALDLANGTDRLTPARILPTTSYPGTGDNSSSGIVVFDPGAYRQRSAITVANGLVYTMYAALPNLTSGGDQRPYTGWIIAFSADTLAAGSVLNVSPNGTGASAWMAGGGAAVDSNGNLFYMTANGSFETSSFDGNGFPTTGDYGNAFLRVATTSGALSVGDYFEYFNAPTDSAADLDLGSGGIMLLPDQADASGSRHSLAVGAGKNGTIYVVDRANLGKYNAAADLNYQSIAGQFPHTVDAVFSSPAWFNGNVFYAAVDDSLKAFPVSGAQLSATASSRKSPSTFATPGATPSVSANGLASGIVWAAENNATNGCVLHAYDAGNLSTELYNNTQNLARDYIHANYNGFTVPTVTAGKVYVSTDAGVAVFGLL
ncbi:MAG TPA: immunoglobulin domain-containing protein [Burkholderiaceae bacterium]|nr:immunoglobulin domain-containing protein [Burkholderiaceae bacterium]